MRGSGCCGLARRSPAGCWRGMPSTAPCGRPGCGRSTPHERPNRPGRAAGRRLHTQLILHDIPRLLLGRDRRRTLEAPTLIIGGKNDALLPPAVLSVPSRFADRITLRTIPGGHYLVDENPGEVLTLVEDYLR